MPQRVLSEAEFNTVRDQVLASLPGGLSEADFNRIAPTKLAQAVGEAESKPAAPEGSALGRFAAGAGEMLNPITMATGLAHAAMHPIDTATSLVNAQLGEGQKAYSLAKEGRLTEAGGHALAMAVPVLGPVAARIGEQAASGDVAGAAGKTAGVLAPFAASELMAARASNPERAALLEREAQQQVAGKVLAPGNPAFRGRAQAIAPELLARKLSGNRLELQQAAEEGMADAGQRLDDAIQSAGGINAPVPVADVVAQLRSRMADLKDSNGVALSDQAAKRIRALDQRMLQVQALGRKTGTATFEDLRKIRDENYRLADEARGYQKQGNPAMADEGWAARETGSVIRKVFADRSPASAAANADYTFWKTLNDVLDPAIGRPKNMAPSQGVTGGARTVGAVTGGMIGGKAGAFIGSAVVPWLKERLADSSWQLADANRKMQLAQALKRGDIGHMRALMIQISKYAKPTSPSESQTPEVPAGVTP